MTSPRRPPFDLARAARARAALTAVALAALVTAAPALAAPARAQGGSGVELGVGADLLLDPQRGAFELTLGGRTPLAQHLSVGGRVGLLLLSEPGRIGVPLDAALRAHFGRVYLEGLVGPWLVAHDGVRFHGALGFGLATRGVHVGLEVGWLDGTSLLGLRLALPI